MNLVLLRHATRSALSMTAFGGDDLGLNTIGLAQAQDFIGAVAPLGTLPAPSMLLASPKLRARQTLTPLSEKLNLPIQIVDSLDERASNESSEKFITRVRNALADVQTLAGSANGSADESAAVYVCTHLDFLEAAALIWPTDFTERESQVTWSTLEYQVFSQSNDGILHAQLRSRIEPRTESRF